MYRSLTLFVLCLFSLSVFAQTPTTLPATGGQDPQPPVVSSRKAGKSQRGGQRGKFLQKMDANSDGKIARDEWKGKAQGFDTLDADKDGFLTAAEIGSVARDKGAKMFQQFDANSDGKIARDEWNQKPRAFDKMDANADGFLTPDELTARKGRRNKQQS
jgi:Ca2+-binding EF-hand superfamily protein